MARFDVKRHVAREALAQLESAGLIIREPNKGAIVRTFTKLEVIELYVVREMLEGGAARLIKLPVESKALDNLFQIHTDHKKAVSAGDLESVFRFNLQFHRDVYRLTGKSTLCEAIDLYAQRTHGIRSYTIGDPLLLERATIEHEKILSALVRSDTSDLVREVINHLQPAKNAYLKRIDSLRAF